MVVCISAWHLTTAGYLHMLNRETRQEWIERQRTSGGNEKENEREREKTLKTVNDWTQCTWYDKNQAFEQTMQ